MLYTIKNIDPRGEEWRYEDDEGHLEFARDYCCPPPDVLYFHEFGRLTSDVPTSRERLIQVLVRIQKQFPAAELYVHHTSSAIPLLKTVEADGWLSFSRARLGHPTYVAIQLGRSEASRNQA